jgi:site-specific recombinase XerC
MKTDDTINQFAGTYFGDTVNLYKGDLNQWLYWCISDRVDPLNAQPGELIAYLTYLRVDLGLAPSSILRKFYSLRAFYGWLVFIGHLAATPFQDVKIPYTSIKNSAVEHKKNKKAKWIEAAAKTDDVQMKAILLLMSDHRLHMTDLCSIKVSDVYPELNQISVSRRGVDTILDVPAHTMGAITDWLNVRSTHPRVTSLFLGPRDGNALQLTMLKFRLKQVEKKLLNGCSVTSAE